MNNIKPYIQLARLNKPIGIWLLFLPCLFGITLASKNNASLNFYEISLIICLFFIGAVLMRSAGCIINDIFDRNIDKSVERTKLRPIASGKISVKQALIMLVTLLIISLFILFQFNQNTIVLGFGITILVALYPLTKRVTYYPQAFLGITFNFGVLMASTAILDEITLPAFCLYISAIIWTIIYDTIYAYQDIEDDLQIGVKSSAIRFGKKPQKILYILAISQTAFLALTGLLSNFQFAYYLWISVVFFHLICQIKSCDFNDGESCLQKFKSNIWIGLLISTAIIFG